MTHSWNVDENTSKNSPLLDHHCRNVHDALDFVRGELNSKWNRQDHMMSSRCTSLYLVKWIQDISLYLQLIWFLQFTSECWRRFTFSQNKHDKLRQFKFSFFALDRLSQYHVEFQHPKWARKTMISIASKLIQFVCSNCWRINRKTVVKSRIKSRKVEKLLGSRTSKKWMDKWD